MARKTRAKSKLGTYLEWHGATIRVVIKVPPSRRAEVGSAHLREGLGTDSPAAAEALKWPVIERLKAKAQGKKVAGRTTVGGDPLALEAVKWRDMLAAKPHFVDVDKWADPDALADRADEVEARHGGPAAARFFSIASGQTTPLRFYVDRWLSEASIAPRTAEKWRKSIKMLETWFAEHGGIELTLEAIDREAAADFVSERMVQTGMNPGTANSYLTGLRAYWTWLVDRKAAKENPWRGLSKPKAKASDPAGDKRPFTDAEVTAILAAITKQPLHDLCLISALSGMRMNEIASLRVSNIVGDIIRLHVGKTKAGRRPVPIHSALSELIKRRCDGKGPDDFLLHELPEQKNPARSRAAPMTQAFTYARRGLGVDERVKGVRQSNIDFHSFRRWFIRKAADALDGGATGFSQWTIAEVVGHSKGDGQLAMTMGRYAGDTSPETLRRCVESVRLPLSQQRSPAGTEDGQGHRK